MTEATMTGDELQNAVLATIRKMTRDGTGVRTTECNDNGPLISWAHGLDPYNGGGCYSLNSGVMKRIITGFIADGTLIPHTEVADGVNYVGERGAYCWLIPKEFVGSSRVASYIKPTTDVWDLY